MTNTNSVAALPNPEQLVEKLLKRLSITRPPIEIPKVISIWQNLQVVEEDLDGAGYLLPLGPLGAEILVNSNDPPERRHFTIAHELGHWVLGLICEKKTGEFKQPSGFARTAIERWCDAFATNLLMPAPLVRAWLSSRDQPLFIDEVLRASGVFKVSDEAFFIRVWELERIQIAVVSLGNSFSIERSYSDPKTNMQLSELLRNTVVSEQLKMTGSMIFFSFRSGGGRISVSGRRMSGGKAVLAVTWPPNQS